MTKDAFELDPDLEREINAALGDQSLEDLMDSGGEGKESTDTRARTGTIVAIHRDEALVEFTAKDQGVCALDQFHPDKPPVVGQRREFIAVAEIPGEGLMRLVLPGGAAKANWESIQQGMTVEAMVTGKNKGGLEL